MISRRVIDADADQPAEQEVVFQPFRRKPLQADRVERLQQHRARNWVILFNRTISRAKLMQMLDAHEPCIVAMEACATSHYWGRVAQSGPVVKATIRGLTHDR